MSVTPGIGLMGDDRAGQSEARESNQGPGLARRACALIESLRCVSNLPTNRFKAPGLHGVQGWLSWMSFRRRTNMPAMAEAKSPGRPRCQETRGAILQAAYELLESGGLAAFTIEAVAERSGAAKTTIYRWWPKKGALAMESFLRVAEQQSPFPETDSPRADLRAHLHLFAK